MFQYFKKKRIARLKKLKADLDLFENQLNHLTSICMTSQTPIGISVHLEATSNLISNFIRRWGNVVGDNQKYAGGYSNTNFNKMLESFFVRLIGYVKGDVDFMLALDGEIIADKDKILSEIKRVFEPNFVEISETRKKFKNIPIGSIVKVIGIDGNDTEYEFILRSYNENRDMVMLKDMGLRGIETVVVNTEALVVKHVVYKNLLC